MKKYTSSKNALLSIIYQVTVINNADDLIKLRNRENKLNRYIH